MNRTDTAMTTTPLRTRGMLAGDVAKALGVGVQTLHYYERQGLIDPPPRSDSGYRLYTPALVERVRFIRKAQALGLPLDEIRDVLRLVGEGASPCGRLRSALAQKLAEIDRRLAELHEFRDELAALVEHAPTLTARQRQAGAVCAIVERAGLLPAVPLATRPLRRRARTERAAS